MHDIGTFLAREDMQRKHPCYIIAPQYGEMMHWAMKDVKDALLKLMDSTINDAGDIDRSRIYIYGYSAGGVGTLRLVREHPGFFAAAVSICGATGTWDINNLLDTPLWMIHAADDNIVKATYRTPGGKDPANLGSRDIYDWYLKKKEEAPVMADIRYTEYPEGWMKEHYGLNPHCSWVTASNPHDTSVWEWMFSKRLGT